MIEDGLGIWHGAWPVREICAALCYTCYAFFSAPSSSINSFAASLMKFITPDSSICSDETKLHLVRL